MAFFFGGGGDFESTRTFSLYRYKDSRALNLSGGVSLPRHLSRVFNGLAEQLGIPLPPTLTAALAEPRRLADLTGMAVQQPRTVCDIAAVVYTMSECCSVIPGLLVTLGFRPVPGGGNRTGSYDTPPPTPQRSTFSGC